MFGDEAILVHDVESAASFLFGQAIPLVHSIPECQDDDDIMMISSNYLMVKMTPLPALPAPATTIL